MKIAITAQGDSLDSALDPRFGRATGFLIVDTDTNETSYKDNEQNLQLAQGAGIQAAMNVAETGVQVVVTGHVGPKAFAALSKGNIEVYYTKDETVSAALESYKGGKLTLALGADKPGHW